MDCDKAIYRVYEYLDGELTVWRRWAIRRHLDECPPCAHGLRLRDRAAPGHRRPSAATRCRRSCKQRIAEALGLAAPPEETGSASGSV